MSAIAAPSLPEMSWLHPVRVCGRLVWNDCKQGLRKHLAGNTRRDKILRTGGLLRSTPVVSPGL